MARQAQTAAVIPRNETGRREVDRLQIAEEVGEQLVGKLVHGGLE